MKETRVIMGLPITIEVPEDTNPNLLGTIFSYFVSVDEQFSTYKETSEITKINKKIITSVSVEMQEVFDIAEQTKRETNGYFNITKPDGSIDPSGIVKGWAIKHAAERLQKMGVVNFFIEAGGDIQAGGTNAEGNDWSVGIRNPFNKKEIVKVIYPRGRGVATSGSYERGNHIYNPLSPTDTLQEIVSITVIGPDILEADRMATAAFAMGRRGVQFIESLEGFEAYSIDKDGIATMTSNFNSLTR